MNFKYYDTYYDFIKNESRIFSSVFGDDSKEYYIDTLMNIHHEVQEVILESRELSRLKLKIIYDKYRKSNYSKESKIRKSEEFELLKTLDCHPNFQDSYKKYIDLLRVRKQKSKRMFEKSCKVIEQVRKKFGNYKVCSVILLDEVEVYYKNDSEIIKYRNRFFSYLRKNKNIPNNSEYISFFSFNERHGFYFNVFILYKAKHKVIDISDVIIDSWLSALDIDCKESSKTYSFYSESQYVYDLNLNYSLDALEERLIYIIACLSFKNLLYSYNFTRDIKTFVSGSLLSTQKSRKNVNQLDLGGDMAIPVNLPNGLSIKIGSSFNQGYSLPMLRSINWYPHSLNNAFLLIVGQSGSGKTYMLRNICNQLIDKNIPVWVFDPHGSMSDLKLEKIFLASGTDSTIGVNPLRIYASDFKQKGVFDYIRSIQSMIKYAIPSMGSNQSAILKKTLDKVYEVYNQNSSVSPRSIKAPSLKNAFDELSIASESSTKKNQDSIQALLNVIEDIFTHPVLTREPDINILDIIKKNIYFDISKLEAKERFIIFETILRQMFEIFSEKEPLKDNELRLVIMVDETRLLNIAGGKSEAYHRMLNVIANEGRKYGISLILASQSSEHFSSDIITNAASKILLKLSNKDISVFSSGNSAISDGLKNLWKNDALFITGNECFFCNTNVDNSFSRYGI